MKVQLNGECFEYDGAKAPMSEALAIEGVYKRRYAEWQTDLAAGSAKAMCVLAWAIWRRAGRAVEFEDILSGAVDFDLNEMLTSLIEGADAERRAQEEAEAESPTEAGSAPAGSASTGTATSLSSPSTSASARGRSVSSRSKTSKR